MIGAMIARSLLTFAALASFSHAAPEKSGHATAEWIAGTSKIEGGKPIQTGIRLVVEEGWHTYWINPGEAGTKFKVAWELPEGWTASEVAYPTPKRFLTGDLPGYGYEGEVIFPVTLTPPANASGTAELGVKVSWLTCNDESCIPGKVELKLSLDAATEKEAAAAIGKSLALVPKPLEGAKLAVTESGGNLNLSLSLPAGSTFDPAGCEVFPVTEQAVDYYKPFQFQKTGEIWTATAGKNEYADGPLKELRLVLAKKGAAPVEVSWKTP